MTDDRSDSYDGPAHAAPFPLSRLSARIDLVAVAAEIEGAGRGQTIRFRTSIDDEVTADADHPIRVAVDPKSGEPSPYVLVRGRLEARILRAPFLELAEWSEPRDDKLGVWSAGAFFPIGPA